MVDKKIDEKEAFIEKNHCLDERTDIFMNTQFKFADIVGESLNKEFFRQNKKLSLITFRPN